MTPVPIDDPEHFRDRAEQCRRLCENASAADKQILVEMAQDLENEATRIEHGER
jgi:hypothetical protein